jgi:organic radical activating enzyme
MKIEYQKPWFLKPKLTEPQTNKLTEGPYSVTLTFKVDRNFKKDDKIGFWGIPGKNLGISYDYKFDLFVFEFWTIENGEPKFNCHTYDCINDKTLQKGLTITITFDGEIYKLFKDFKLFDTIINNNPLVEDYKNESIYLGCHNIDSLNPIHRCITEMDVFHFSIFDKAIDIHTLENIITKATPIINTAEYDNTYCFFNFNQNGDEFLIFDELKNLCFLKKKNKMSTVGFEIMKNKLDAVGPGFCLAKWTQVTMHLHNGTTHSCHHPEPHKVHESEIGRNPTALHNSKIKKQARKEMLTGKRPAECNYCWNVEDTSNSFSDRTFKSAEPWSEPYYNEISKSDWKKDFNPKYAEVSFSNTCNFKCAYCGPEYSSKWVEEINDYGAYMMSFEYNGLRRMEERNTVPFKHSEHNPYVEAFWEWFPELYENLDTFRITGGEPLLSKDTWKVLDYIIESETPNKNLKLSINSNLGVPDELVDKLIQKIDKIISEERVKELIIFTSCDGYGKQAEYTRFGLDFEKLFNNIDKILTILPKVTIVVMSTFNVFSVFSYEKLIKKIHEFKLKHFNNQRYWNSAIILDTSYLRHPPFLSFRILKDYITTDYFDRWLKFMKFNSTFRSINFHKMQQISDVGFSTQEIEKIARIRDMFITDMTIDIRLFDKDKKDFLTFIKEYEIRRKVNCLEYYPELTKFINDIEDAN